MPDHLQVAGNRSHILNFLVSLFMTSGRSIILDTPIDVSAVGEKFGKPIEIPYVGYYLIEPEFKNYQEITNFDNLSEKEKLYEKGGNISLKISFECNEEVINLETQKIYSGVISGFSVPNDIPRGQCTNLSIYVLESDPSFTEKRGNLNIVIQRLPK